MNRPNPRVAVTDVVRITRCEKQAQLDGRFGESRDAHTEGRRREGIQAHARFEHQNDRRCYVATAVFGAHAPETQRLRRWRDTVLAPSPWGRFVIRTYYRASPWCLRHLPRAMAVPTRWALRAGLRWLPPDTPAPSPSHPSTSPSSRPWP